MSGGWPLRRFVVAVAIAVGAIGLVGCSSDGGEDAAEQVETITFDFSGDAATVNGKAIPAQELSTLLDGFRKAPGAVQPVFGVDTVDQDAESGQPKPDIVANLLSTAVMTRVIEDEVAKRGLPVSDTNVALASTQLDGQFGDALQSAPALREELIRRYAVYITLDRDLRPPDPDEATLRAEYAKDPAQWQQACVRHILVETEQEAKDAQAELAAGKAFAEVAKARSTDPGSGAQGGDLGCQAAGMYVEPFEKAVWEGQIGVVQGPVKTDFGFHLIEVTERKQRTFEEVREELLAGLQPQAFEPLGQWLEGAMAAATITIDARFGTWNAEARLVDPLGAKTEGLTFGTDPAGSSTSTSTTSTSTTK